MFRLRLLCCFSFQSPREFESNQSLRNTFPHCFNKRTLQICCFYFFLSPRLDHLCLSFGSPSRGCFSVRVAVATVGRSAHSLALLEELVDWPSLRVDAFVGDTLLVQHAPLRVVRHFPGFHSCDCVPHSHGISVEGEGCQIFSMIRLRFTHL